VSLQAQLIEGIAKAESAGKYKGLKPIAPERRQHVLRLAADGATKISIARQLGIGEATMSRILAVAKAIDSIGGIQRFSPNIEQSRHPFGLPRGTLLVHCKETA
jgi:DNA invertase Pin-like site-specific DNA recombinase